MISGLGGIGKTQTAIEFVRRFKDVFSSVFWISGGSETAFRYGLASLSKAINIENDLSIDEYCYEVRRWLSENSNWLLILDNVNRIDEIKSIIPSFINGVILITSRKRDFFELGIPSPIVLDVLSEKDSIDFLNKRIRKIENEQELISAKLLCENLGYFPLALEQAASYISSKFISFEKYLLLFHFYRLKLLERVDRLSGEYDETICTTWEINFSEVQQECLAASHILWLFSFFASESIPFLYVSICAEFLSEEVIVKAKAIFSINELLEPLARYSLIQIDPLREVFSIHRLVQDVVIDALSDQLKEICFLASLKVIDEAQRKSSFDLDQAINFLKNVQSIAEKGLLLFPSKVDSEGIREIIFATENLKLNFNQLKDIQLSIEDSNSIGEFLKAFNEIASVLEIFGKFEFLSSEQKEFLLPVVCFFSEVNALKEQERFVEIFNRNFDEMDLNFLFERKELFSSFLKEIKLIVERNFSLGENFSRSLIDLISSFERKIQTDEASISQTENLKLQEIIALLRKILGT